MLVHILEELIASCSLWPQEAFESNRRDITNAMMKNYPQLLHKFMAEKEKVAPLVEVIIHINLELYSLKSKEQVGFF